MSSSSSSPISNTKSPVSNNSGASQVANSSCNQSPSCTNAISINASTTGTTAAATASASSAPAGAVASTISVYRSARSALSSAVPMKLFAAWEVEKTPSNCIPRLCTLTLSKLSLTRRFAAQVHSVAIAAKMRSSKRTLRSHEIDLSHYLQSAKGDTTTTTAAAKENLARSTSTDQTINNTHARDIDSEKDSNENSTPRSSADCTLPTGNNERHIQVASRASAVSNETHSNHVHSQSPSNRVTENTSDSDDYISIDLDLTFALQYPHFLKKNDNQLQILLQRRKRYKNRAMLGFKTLASGIVDLTEVLQRSQLVNKQLQLYVNSKDSPSNESTVAAKLIITSLKSTPVDACDVNNGNSVARIRQVSTVSRPAARSFKSYSSRLKRLNLKHWPSSSHRDDPSAVFHLNDSAELDSDEEVCDDFSLSGESDSEVTIDTVARAMMSHADYNRRLSLKKEPEESTLITEPCVIDAPCSSWKHHHTSEFSSSRLPNGIKWIRSNHKASSIHPTDHCSSQRNFKQKFFSLLKKFKITDSEASDSEEGDTRGKVSSKRGKTSKLASPDSLPLDRIDDLELDLDTDDSFDGELDDLSICSVARPGLKPFFSSKSTLVEDNAFADTSIISDSYAAAAESLRTSAAATRSAHPSTSKSTNNSTSSYG